MFAFNNYHLKKWLQGDKARRRRLLNKLKKDICRLGWNKQTKRNGLIQLTIKPHVVLSRLSVCSYGKNLVQSHSTDRNLSHNNKMKRKNLDDDEEKWRSKNSKDIPQQYDAQIANAAIKTASINTTNVNNNNVCQRESQKCNLSKTSADTSQNFITKSANVDSNIDIVSSSVNCENNEGISPEKYQEKERELKQILFLVKSKLINTLQECSLGLKNESNVCSPINTNSESNSKAISNNIANECRDVSVLMKETDVNLELVDHINTPLRQAHVTKNTIKMNIKKITRKRIKSKKSLDTNVSATQMQKKSRGTVKNVYEETLNNNAETSDNELSSTKQIDWKSIEQEVRKTESIRLRKRKNKIKLNNLIKNKRAKLHKCFRDINDPDTSESEEEREILFNHLKKKTRQSDDSLYKVTTNEIKDILKQNKILVNDTSANNLSKDIKSSASFTLKSGNSRDSGSTKKCCNYSSIIDEETEDEASVCDRSVDNLQRSLSKNFDDSTTCTEKYFSMYDETTDEETENAGSIHKQGISPIGEITDIGISTEIKSANSNDSSEYIKKCYAANGATTENDETLSNNSPINVENATSSNVKCEDSCDSAASTAKYNSHDTTDKDVKARALLCKNGHINKSQENDQEKITNVIPVGTTIDNSCDSTTNTEESNALHDARTEKMGYEVLICTSDKSFGNSKKIVEDTISTEINSDNLCESSTRMEECNTMHDAAMENTKDKASICIPDVLPNNLQTNVESAIPLEIKSNYSCDSTVSLEDKKDENEVSLRKHDSSQESTNSAISVGEKSGDLNDSRYIRKQYTIRNEEMENRASSYKCDTVSNNSQENIKDHKVAEKEQYIENSNNDIPFTTEINFEKDNSENINLNPNAESKIINGIYVEPNTRVFFANQQEYQEVRNIDSTDLARCKNVQNHVTSVSKLPIEDAHKSTSCNMNEKNIENVKNLLLTCNDIIKKDGKPIEQLSVITSTSETISSERNHDRSFSVQASDLSSSSSISSDNGDDHSLDDDNNDIEIQIQIRPKQKHQQALRKISLKAPWSAVNTCINNLNTLKEDPALLNKFFNMGDKISGKSTSKKSLENNTPLINNQTVTTETEHCDIRCDSSPITKDNENDSQRQNFQESVTLNENKNTMDSNKEEKNKLTQSVIITTKNNLESNKLTYNMPDLEQLQKTEMNAKQEINKEQKSSNNTIVEEATSLAECKGKENPRVSSTEQEKMQKKTIGNSVDTACTSNVKKQLHTSDNAAAESSKPRLQSFRKVSYQYTVKATNFNTPAPSENAFSTFRQSVAPQSALELLPQLVSQPTPQPTFQSEPQSMYPRVSSFQLTPQQSRFQLSAPVPSQVLSLPLVPLQIVSSPEVPVQTVSSQKIPPQVVLLPKVDTLDFDKLPPPPYNANRHINIPLKTNSSVQINNQNNDRRNLILKAILDLYTNVKFFRTFLQETRSQHDSHFVQIMVKAMRTIKDSLNNLQVWLNKSNVNVISHINEYFILPLYEEITLDELKNYHQLVQQYLLSLPTQNIKTSNDASQYSNIGETMPSVNAQSVPRPAPKKGKIPKQNCAPKVPRSTPKVSSTNQQQLFSNPVNLYSPKQSVANVQQHTSFTPSSHMPNTNWQQFVKNTNNSMQGQYIPSTNPSNVNAQHRFTNNNVPPPTNISYWISYQKNKLVCGCDTCSTQTKPTFVPQSQYNIQTQSGQNVQPNQNLQHKLTKQRSKFSKNVPTSNNANSALYNSKKILQKPEVSSTSPQDLSQKTSNACNNVPQNTYDKTKALTLPEPSVLQSTISLQETNKVSKSISKPNNTPIYKSNLSFLTHLQKIILRNQLAWFLFRKDTLRYSCESKKSIQQLHNDRTTLFHLFYHLHMYINDNIVKLDHTEQNNIIDKSNTSEKCAESDSSQNNTLQNKSIELQESAMQISINEFAKSQSNMGDKNLEAQSPERSVDSNISESSKSTAINGCSKTQSEKLPLIQKFPKVTENMEQQKQNNDNLKKTFQEGVSVDAKKQPEINETLLPRHSKTSEGTVQMLSVANSKAENNITIDKSLKAASLYDEKFPKAHSCSLQSRLNLSRDTLIKETKDQSEIIESTANEKFNNVETKIAHGTSNAIILKNNNKENNTTQCSHNIINQNIEIHNTSGEISSENLQDKMPDNVNDSNKVLNQLNVLYDLVSNLNNNTEQSISRMEKCASLKISQVHAESEKCTEILSNCSKSPQLQQMKAFKNEESANANEESCDGMSDCSEKLYIDENMEDRQKHDRCDEASSSKDDDFYTLHRVDSPWPLDVIKHDPSEVMPIFLLTNPIDISRDIVDKRRNAATFNGELSEGERAQESTFKFEDEWNMEQIEATKENGEQLKAEKEEESEEEVSLKLYFSEDESNTQDSLTHSTYIQDSIEVIKEETIIDVHDSFKSEDDLNKEESTIQSTNRELAENMREQSVIDTHSNIRTINEQLKHFSEQKPGKSQTHSLNFNQKDNAEEEIMLYQHSNDICDTNIECISVKSDDSEITTVPSILNVKSIPASLFEKIDMDKCFEGDVELDGEVNKKSLDVNKNLGNSDDVDDSNCLRCNRKSTVLCKICLKAQYCSKRCSDLHWKARHYKECKGKEIITCINL